MTPIRAYWPKTPLPGNMGDLLTIPIVRYLSGEDPLWVSHGTAGVLFGCGSIIRFSRTGTHVYGTGAIGANDRPDPGAFYHAVRGPLTADIVQKCTGTRPSVLGDPALVLPCFHQTPVIPNGELGIVPHYVDYRAAHEAWGRLDGVRIIQILRDDPLKVVDEIRSCSAIISSSLHGLIVAQAYDIPAAVIRPLKGMLSGDGLKFHDYELSTGQPPTDPIQITGKESRDDLLALTKHTPLEFDRSALLAAWPFEKAPQWEAKGK